MKPAQFIIGILILIGIEILKVYYIMPFPGSQRSESIDLAYFIHTNILWFRLIGWLLIIFPVIHYFRYGKLRAKIAISILIIAYGFVFYKFNFEFLADKMFL